MDGERLASELARLGASVGPATLLDVTGSTNDDARALAKAGARQGAFVLANAQTRGRGRGSHRWHSPPGDGLYLSIVWYPTLEPSRLALLALAVGIGVARAVDATLREPRARIKWPNDVYVDDRKMAGVLVEASLSTRSATATLGVGLNVGTATFPEVLEKTATSLYLAGARSLEREAVAAMLLASVIEACRELETTDANALFAELAARDWLRGRAIAVGPVEGVADGIDVDGRLLVRTAEGERVAVVAGEVSLRVAPRG